VSEHYTRAEASCWPRTRRAHLGPVPGGRVVIDTRLISRADQLAALDRMTETAIATLTGTLMIPVVGFFNIPAAQADSLTAKEYSFVTEYGQSVICPTVAKYHSVGGVVGVVKGVMDQGFSAEEAVTVVNYSVATYCDSLYPLLTKTGEYFRNQAGGRAV